MRFRLVLIRHGESEGNRAQRFTGWADVPLSETGLNEAGAAGELLKKNGFSFDLAFTSVLRRANQTLNRILDRLDLLWIPVEKTWRLNERHYGALEGQNKSEVRTKFGDDLYDAWRRSYRTRPPSQPETFRKTLARDPRYREVPFDELPLTESLADCVDRILPYWQIRIVPQILAGKRVLICAHGSTVRSFLKLLLNIGEDHIRGWDVPNAVPLVVELDSDLQYLRHRYLGDPRVVNAKIRAVRYQGKM